MERTHEIHSTIYDKSLSYYFKEEYQSRDKISLIMREMIARGEKINVENYHDALEAQNRLIAEMDDFMSGFDAVICLSTAGAAPLRNVHEKPDSALMWTLTHLPAISAPVFVSPHGAPYGLQLVARKYNDLLLMNFLEYLQENGLVPENPNPLLFS